MLIGSWEGQREIRCQKGEDKEIDELWREWRMKEEDEQGDGGDKVGESE